MLWVSISYISTLDQNFFLLATFPFFGIFYENNMKNHKSYFSRLDQ